MRDLWLLAVPAGGFVAHDNTRFYAALLPHLGPDRAFSELTLCVSSMAIFVNAMCCRVRE
jgi:hypothetical protein